MSETIYLSSAAGILYTCMVIRLNLKTKVLCTNTLSHSVYTEFKQRKSISHGNIIQNLNSNWQLIFVWEFICRNSASSSSLFREDLRIFFIRVSLLAIHFSLACVFLSSRITGCHRPVSPMALVKRFLFQNISACEFECMWEKETTLDSHWNKIRLHSKHTHTYTPASFPIQVRTNRSNFNYIENVLMLKWCYTWNDQKFKVPQLIMRN